MTKKEAVRIVEGTIGDHPETKVIRRKEAAIERKYASVDGYHFCSECSAWTPGEPPEIKALGKAWKKVFDREIGRVRKTEAVA